MDGYELLHDATGTLDSGTSCLIIPKAAFDRFQQKQQENPRSDPQFTLTIQGHDFKFSAYTNRKLCVRTLKKVPKHFLIGDVFFRQHVIVHDLRNLEHPVLGIAAQRPGFIPVKAKPQEENIFFQMEAGAGAALQEEDISDIAGPMPTPIDVQY